MQRVKVKGFRNVLNHKALPENHRYMLALILKSADLHCKVEMPVLLMMEMVQRIIIPAQ